MKSLLIGMALILSSSLAFACDKDGVMDDSKSFEEQKKESLKMIENHEEALKKAKACLSAATAKAEVAKCHEEMRQAEKKCGKKCGKKCDHSKKGKKHHAEKDEE